MSNEQVKEEAAEVMTAAIASRGSTVEFDLERPNLEVVKKTAQFLHVVPSYSAENPNRGAFVSLATQDFLQPLERGSRESSGKASAQSATSVNGDIPLQLSSRDREDPIGKESYSTRIQLPNLRMQYGYMEHPHAHVSKAGLEASQQPVMNRHWQQNPNPVSSGNKRPRSAQSEGDDTDVEERRKVHRDDASSRSIELKSSTSRSKHSATEQRRRSKINDRFQMLRDLLPQGDQKRDKASFLLEVIEYIQVLQDKVKKFEALEKVRQQERLKQAAWDMHASTSLKESTLQETAKPRGPSTTQENRSVQVSNPASSVQGVNQAAVQTAAQVRTRPLPEARAVENLTREDIQKAVAVAPVHNTVAARQCEESTPNPKEPLKNGQEELPIKQGVISLSSAYSQGLLQALTNALQSSGLDLSKANISVQIELGKPSETTNKASQQ